MIYFFRCKKAKANGIKEHLETERINTMRSGKPDAARLIGDLIRKRVIVVGVDESSMIAERIAEKCGCHIEYMNGLYKAQISF